MVSKHRVYLSYSSGDEYYRDYILLMNRRSNIFASYFMGEKSVDDEELTTSQVRKIVREDRIKTAEVLVLLCGKETSKSKKVDQEIYSAMYDTSSFPKLGILVINLQGSRNCSYAVKEDKPLIAPLSSRPFSSSRAELEKAFPELPDRIIDNLIKGVPITVIDWTDAKDKPDALIQLIENAAGRRSTNEYDHSAPLMREDL